MRRLPESLTNIECPDLHKAITEAGLSAAQAWELEDEDATTEVAYRLSQNRVSRKSLASAKRYLRTISEEDYEE